MFPDIVLIDGGLGQLHAALDAFKAMEIQPPVVVALAKKKELLFVQGQNKPLQLARTNQALKLLQYVRDEAHRFVQHYFHILRRKETFDENKG